MSKIDKNDKIMKVEKLHKSYKDIHAVKGIDFEVRRKESFAFLGPNGAGKSTTIDILTTVLKKDSGKIIIDGLELGKDDFAIKKIIGVVFQDKMLDNLLTVKENLTVRSKLYHKIKEEQVKNVEQALEMTNTTSLSKRIYKTLSGGQKRRVDIARALLNKPKILFLDEPTTGLDPASRKLIWKTINRLKEEFGMTVFLTTHYMEEADTVDYVVIILEGKITACGTPLELKDLHTNDYLIIKPKDISEFRKMLDKDKIKYSGVADYVKIELEKSIDSIEIINKYKNDIINFEVLRGSLDDAFVSITGKGIEDYA